jgi:CHAP domain
MSYAPLKRSEADQRQARATQPGIAKTAFPRAKLADQAWERDFFATVNGQALRLNLHRSEDGTLTGQYGTTVGPGIHPVIAQLKGKVLEDNDIYLQGDDGSRWHGRYTNNNTLFFGSITRPGKPREAEITATDITFTPARPLSLQPRVEAPDLSLQGKTLRVTVNENQLKLFNLEQTGERLNGSFQLSTIGEGTIRGSVTNAEQRSVKLEAVFTRNAAESKRDVRGDSRTLIGALRETPDGFTLEGVWRFVGVDGKTIEYPLETENQPATPSGTDSSAAKQQPDGAKSWEETITPAMRDKLPALKEAGFLPGVEALARRLSVPRDHLLALMMLESSLIPSKDNGMGYYGLIQIGKAAQDDIDKYIRKNGVGLQKLVRASKVAQLSGVQQLPYIEIHFLEHGIRERIADFHIGGKPITLEELYMSVLAGNASIASKPAWKKSPGDGYENNSGLDGNKDGTITPTEATDALRLRWRETFGTNLDERNEHLERVGKNGSAVHDEDVSDLPRNVDPSQAFWEASIEEQRAYKKNGMNDWGEVLGEANGVKAYFNAGDTGNQGRNKLMKDGKEEYDFGLKWQCVEFIRRYLYTVKGHAFAERGHAKEYFNESTPDGGSYRGLTQYSNDLKQGSQSKPQIHDLIVIREARENGGVGHVAIVIDVADDYVTIAQQNVGTQFTDTIKLSGVKHGKDTHWKLDDARVYGWLRKG